MAVVPNQSGAFVPTSFIFDISQIYQTDTSSPEFKELIVKLYQYLNQISLSTNIRDAGFYNLQEFVNGQQYFSNPTLNSLTPSNATQRQVFRMVINFGALPNTATKSVAHNISPTIGFTFTRIYATASDTTGLTYIPIPFASPTLVENIKLDVDATNVNITTGSNRTNYNNCYVVLEYLKF